MEGGCRWNNDDTDQASSAYTATEFGTLSECMRSCLDSATCVAMEFVSEPRDDGAFEYAACVNW